MKDLYTALVLSGILSILLSFIQITYDTKIYKYKSYFTVTYIFYIIIMIIGNLLTTLIAAGIIDSYNSQNAGELQETQKTLILQGPIWVWYSVFGVFGFEAIIKQLNVTFFNKGLLSINDWINKAKKSASAATIENFSTIEIENTRKLAYELTEKFDSTEINTLAHKLLGSAVYDKIISTIKAKKDIDQSFHLANILADSNPAELKAEIKAKKA